MKLLKLIFVFQLIGITAYTLYVSVHEGWILVDVFFGDLVALNWSGQFNFDFLNYLILSAIWIAWRHQFSLSGLIFAVLASVLGILFFAPYLLYQSMKCNGDPKKLLLGDQLLA